MDSKDELAVNYCLFRRKIANLMICATNDLSVQKIMHSLKVIFARCARCVARFSTRPRCSRHSAHAQTEKILLCGIRALSRRTAPEKGVCKKLCSGVYTCKAVLGDIEFPTSLPTASK